MECFVVLRNQSDHHMSTAQAAGQQGGAQDTQNASPQQGTAGAATVSWLPLTSTASCSGFCFHAS